MGSCYRRGTGPRSSVSPTTTSPSPATRSAIVTSEDSRNVFCGRVYVTCGWAGDDSREYLSVTDRPEMSPRRAGSRRHRMVGTSAALVPNLSGGVCVCGRAIVWCEPRMASARFAPQLSPTEITHRLSSSSPFALHLPLPLPSLFIYPSPLIFFSFRPPAHPQPGSHARSAVVGLPFGRRRRTGAQGAWYFEATVREDFQQDKNDERFCKARPRARRDVRACAAHARDLSRAEAARSVGCRVTHLPRRRPCHARV